ncbi:MAG TPA: DNA primase, partial [Alistipes sp.]|nr:DNA primase [Alistipes sp.]
NYVPSQLWQRKEVHVESTAEMLAVGVPKAVTLYRSKIIEGLIKELQGQLDGLPEEEQTPLIQRLAALNQAKVTIAHKLQRLIL